MQSLRAQLLDLRGYQRRCARSFWREKSVLESLDDLELAFPAILHGGKKIFLEQSLKLLVRGSALNAEYCEFIK